MTNILLLSLGVNLISLLVIVYMDARHFNERKDLYDRIMSGDINRYQAYQGHAPKPKGETNFVKRAIDQAQREQYGKEDD